MGNGQQRETGNNDGLENDGRLEGLVSRRLTNPTHTIKQKHTRARAHAHTHTHTPGNSAWTWRSPALRRSYQRRCRQRAEWTCAVMMGRHQRMDDDDDVCMYVRTHWYVRAQVAGRIRDPSANNVERDVMLGVLPTILTNGQLP